MNLINYYLNKLASCNNLLTSLYAKQTYVWMTYDNWSIISKTLFWDIKKPNITTAIITHSAYIYL